MCYTPGSSPALSSKKCCCLGGGWRHTRAPNYSGHIGCPGAPGVVKRCAVTAFHGIRSTRHPESARCERSCAVHRDGEIEEIART